MPHPPQSNAVLPALPFADGPDAKIFRFTYGGPAALLREALLERYRYGRSVEWARTFFPARVCLNDAPVTGSTRVAPGDRVAYLHLRSEEPPAPPLAPPLFEDDWLVALAKGDQAPVNPSGVYYFTSLVIQAREAFGNPELTPLHRLDLETSGPVLFAKRSADLKTCHGLFHRKILRKRYRALVHGAFPLDLREIRGRIVPDEGSSIHTKLRLAPPADTEGDAAGLANGTGPQTSLTRVLKCVRNPEGRFSELLLEPVTGKTNQLRVHLAHVGHPIVGDKKYHPDERVFLDWFAHRDFARLRTSLLLPRQALHCAALSFPHPFTGEPVSIEAPPEQWAAKLTGLSFPGQQDMEQGQPLNI